MHLHSLHTTKPHTEAVSLLSTIRSISNRLSFTFALVCVLFPAVLLAQEGADSATGVNPYEMSFEDFEWDESAKLTPVAGAKSVARTPSVAAALKIVRKQLEESPSNPAARTLLGELLLRHAKQDDDLAAYSQSAKELRAVLADSPDYRPAKLALAETLLAMHEFEEALEIATKLDSETASSPRLLAILFDAQVELGKYAAASKALSRLKTAEWSSPVMARAARLAEIHGDFDKAIKLISDATEHGEASGYFSKSDLAWYSWRKGQLHLKAAQVPQAKAYFEIAQQAAPGDEAALVGLAHAHFAEGDLAKAIATLRLAAEGEAPPVLALLGDALALHGDTAEAEKLWLRTEELMREEAKLAKVPHAREVAMFYADHDRNAREALELAKLDLAQRRDPFALDAFAWVLLGSGNVQEARSASEQALAAIPTDPQILFHAAVIAEANGDLGSSRQHAESLLKTNARFSITYFRQFEQLLRRLALAP